jgi:aminobutyraldehyde dehydrogenase
VLDPATGEVITPRSRRATLAENSYYNSGQDSTAPCRVVAGTGIYDELVSGLGSAASALVVGDPSDEATEIGPVISEAQRVRVAGMVDRSSRPAPRS